jgi:hypothetical protein
MAQIPLLLSAETEPQIVAVVEAVVQIPKMAQAHLVRAAPEDLV